MADTALKDLTAAASVEATDLLYVVKDPSGTPLNRKATGTQVAAFIDAAGAASSAVSTHVAAGDPHTQYKLETDFSANGASLVSAANYAAMRALLDLEAGTDFYSIAAADAAFQPKNANLTTFAGITPSANVQTFLGAADYAAMRTQLGLVIGTNVQAYDADLATIAGLTATTDNFLQAKSSAWASRTPTQVTADLIAMVGDSGSGGTKGLVPAPAAGDAAAAKFLKADGTWAAPSGGGGGSVSDTAYASSWDGVTTDAPSKNAVYDKIESLLFPVAPISNNYAVLQHDGPYALVGSGSGASDTLYCGFFRVFRRITITVLGITVTSTSATNAQVAIYPNVNGKPGSTAIVTTGNLSMASATNVTETLGSAVTLEPGGYWAIINRSGTAGYAALSHGLAGPSVTMIGSATLSDVGTSTPMLGLTVARTFGSWGDISGLSYSAITGGTSRVPILLTRFQ